MSLLNEISDKGSITRGEMATFITLLNPFAPHLTEELNEWMGNTTLLTYMTWPQYDPAKCVDEQVEIVVQICGKIKARLMVSPDASQEEVKAAAMENEAVRQALEGKSVVKEIYVKGKLLNIVAK